MSGRNGHRPVKAIVTPGAGLEGATELVCRGWAVAGAHVVEHCTEASPATFPATVKGQGQLMHHARYDHGLRIAPHFVR